MDAFYASDNERVISNVAHQIEFTYGEALCIHLLPLLEYVKPQPGEVFWDIGCGSSRPLLVASLFYPTLKVCKGVDFLKQLVDLSNQVIMQTKELSVKNDIDLAPIDVS